MTIKQRASKFLVLSMIFALSIVLLAPAASAQSIQKSEEEEIENIAKELEFIFEEALIKDEKGKFIGFDTEKLENEFGLTPEIENLIKVQESYDGSEVCEAENPRIGLAGPALDNCITKKIKKGYGEIITGSILSGIVDSLQAGDYTGAGKKLVKLGVRGSAVGIGVNLATYLFTCLWEIS